MDIFAKKTAKDRMRIPAEFYNLVVDAVRFYLRSTPDRKSEKIAVRSQTQINIKNVSGSTLEQYAVVGIGDALVAPRDDDTSFYGDAYLESAAPAAASPFAILQDPAVDDGFAPATCAGFSFVRLSVTNTAHAYAVPSAGVYTHLVSQSAVGPATILWKEAGGTLLNGAINNSVAYITVDSGDGYPDVPFVITLDSEDLNVTAVRGATQLNEPSGIDDTQTTINVDSAAGFPTSGSFVIVIGTERMNVTAGGGTTTWTVTRGYQNSTANQHSDNDPVEAAANTYWTVTRAYNSTSAASHSDNAPVTMKSGVVWALVRIDSQGSGSSGVTSINGDSTAAQVFSVGTSGTDFAITDTGAGTLRWDLPDWSTSNRGALTATGNQTGRGTKTLENNNAGIVGKWQATTSASAATFAYLDFNGVHTEAVSTQYSDLRYQYLSFITGDVEIQFSAANSSANLFVNDNTVGADNTLAFFLPVGGYTCYLWTNDYTGAALWDVGTAYVVGNNVTVEISGDLEQYTCILNNTGNTPPNGTYWRFSGRRPRYAVSYSSPYSSSPLFGKWGTTGGGDTVSGGIITTLGTPITSTSLNLEIGTDVQAWSSELDALVAAAPVSDIGALTDSTGGTADTTLAAVSGTGDDATVNDNFADLAAQVNAIRSALQTLGLMA